MRPDAAFRTRVRRSRPRSPRQRKRHSEKLSPSPGHACGRDVRTCAMRRPFRKAGNCRPRTERGTRRPVAELPRSPVLHWAVLACPSSSRQLPHGGTVHRRPSWCRVRSPCGWLPRVVVLRVSRTPPGLTDASHAWMRRRLCRGRRSRLSDTPSAACPIRGPQTVTTLVTTSTSTTASAASKPADANDVLERSGRSARPYDHLEGLVTGNGRGGSSPLRRTSENPANWRFLMVADLLVGLAVQPREQVLRTWSPRWTPSRSREPHSRWDWLLVRRGLVALARAQSSGATLGPYTLQAAIAACHARARVAEETDWEHRRAL
jgi:hypothetical protein